ncbi:MAG: hypothetical protein JXQ69_06745 [Paludibacteraceae bacterium]|nr:hypothetical protein [Paludibacteraceae bacterium]MBN2788003.1 hypothetical protein [Paludibacteraceae bacterium]
MNYKNIKFIILFFLLTFPVGLLAQDSPTENKPVVIRKQLFTEEVEYIDIPLSSMVNIYVSPVLVSNYSINQISDSSKYNSSHFHSPTISLGLDYSIIYNSFYVKTGIGFLWIKENKYNCVNEIASDTSFIDTASYVVAFNKNSTELVAANYVYLTVPFTVGKIFTLGKFKIMPEVGINLDFLLFADGYTGATPEESIKVTREELNAFKTRLFLANSFAYSLNKNMQLYLQPWFAFSLNPEFKSSSLIPDFKTDLYGIRLGVIFN